MNTYSNAGIVLSPSKTKVLCSYYTDFGSYGHGCDFKGHVKRKRVAFRPYNATMLKHMLKISMRPGTEHYNEVLIDSRAYTRKLPYSIAAFVFFEDHTPGDGTQTTEQARLKATRAYVHMLDAYNLTEAELPLIKVIRPNRLPIAVASPQDAAVEDASRGAREYLSQHAKEVYRERRRKRKEYLSKVQWAAKEGGSARGIEGNRTIS